MDQLQLSKIQNEPGVSDFFDLSNTDFGYTAVTRKLNQKKERQIDHMLSDFRL